MLILSSAYSWRVAPSAAPAAPVGARVVIHAPPARTAAGLAALSNSASLAARGAAAPYDGRNSEGLQRVLQSLTPSMLAAIESGERRLTWLGHDPASRVARGAPLSGLERVYEWCADTAGQFFGGSAEAAPAAPTAWRGERDAGRAAVVREQPGSAGARASRSVSAEDFVAQFDGRPRRTHCNTADRTDPDAYFPSHINPGMCPTLSRTVSIGISARAVGTLGGAQRTLEGAQGVLTRVRVTLPSDAATLTAMVSRGGAPDAGRWSRQNGIAGVVARIVSGDRSQSVPNLANCEPVEPRDGRQVCTIPVEQGRVDGKRFVWVEVFATRGGTPILLEVASQPA